MGGTFPAHEQDSNCVSHKMLRFQELLLIRLIYDTINCFFLKFMSANLLIYRGGQDKYFNKMPDTDEIYIFFIMHLV